MELIRTKYNQTEVGMIPEDWDVVKFSDVADKNIKNSITGGPFGSNLKTNDYTNDGVQIIQLQNIGDGQFIDESVVYTSDEKADELKSCNIYPGELILSKMGDPVARACFMPFKAKRFLMASDGIRLVVNEKDFSKYFVFQYINSRYFRNRAIDISTGSTRQRIGLPDLKSLNFIKPTLIEQKAIATALSDVDALITNLDKLITKKRAIKQGAMQQLLTPPDKGGKRLPGFSGEWVEKIIGKIGNTYGGLSGKSKIDFENGKYPYITFLNVMNNTVIDTSIFEYVHIKLGEQQNTARKGDLFFNTSSETPEEVGMCALLNEEIEKLYLNSFCFGYRVKEDSDIDGLFFSYLMNSEIGRALFLSLAQGATRYNLSKSNFNKLIIEVPGIMEQKTIAKTLSDMDSDIELLQTKKSKYQSIKQGMMQELLTGKTRLV